jgi:hypothetical protein
MRVLVSWVFSYVPKQERIISVRVLVCVCVCCVCVYVCWLDVCPVMYLTQYFNVSLKEILFSET